MLPDKLLSYTRVGDALVPTWLTAADEGWLRIFIDEIRALDGASMGDIEDRIRDRILPEARRNGARSRAAEGVWAIERARLPKASVATIEPRRIRRVVFQHAASMERPDAITAASAELGIGAELVEAWLFADRLCARRVQRMEPVAAREVIDRYNLILAQSFMVRASSLVATIRGHSRTIVSSAKLRGLMVSFFDPHEGDAAEASASAETFDTGLALAISGPLALFHETTKYGRLLAGLLPTIATTPGWSVHARLRVSGEPLELTLDTSAPLPRTRELPPDCDSLVERRFARELRRLRTEWSLRREDVVVRVGRRLFFPDFSLVGPRGRVLVEIVGYWTADYLAAKVEALRHVDVPIVVCVDERHADAGFRALPGVVTYRKRVDARAVLEEAGRQVERFVELR